MRALSVPPVAPDEDDTLMPAPVDVVVTGQGVTHDPDVDLAGAASATLLTLMPAAPWR